VTVYSWLALLEMLSFKRLDLKVGLNVYHIKRKWHHQASTACDVPYLQMTAAASDMTSLTAR